MREFYSVLRPAWVPVAIIAATAPAAALLSPLPASLAGLSTAGPYAVLATGTLLAWWYNRGRSFVILASLLAAFAAFELFPTKAVYTALVVIVPFNALMAMIRPERGARYRMAYRWLVLLAGEALLVAWIAAAGRSPVSGTWWNTMLDWWLFRSPPTPLVGRLAFAAAFIAAVTRAWPDHTPLQVGNCGALAAFFIAAENAGAPASYTAFMTAAGIILIAALLQESHQLAFRDSLTGLPGRRALEERLRSLAEALPQIEALRGAIERYRMAVRGEDRPKKAAEGSKRRGAGTREEVLSVTVSIGAAGPSESAPTPHHVIKAADEALYRAKKAGRNRVSQ